jgi:DNA-binding GntR family transcriptional regulator
MSDATSASDGNPLLKLSSLAQSHARRATAHEFVREAIRQGILSGLLPGGLQLGQAQIAEALGVSTTPVREALRDLSSEGLVDFSSYRTPVVHQPTHEELYEVYDLRRLLESHAIAKVVASIDDARLAKADAVQDQMDAEEDIAKWLVLNAKFHAVLTAACNSSKLESFLDALRASVALYVGLALRRNPQRRVESNKEHREILEACRARDVERAVKVVQLHMDPARDLAESALGVPGNNSRSVKTALG